MESKWKVKGVTRRKDVRQHKVYFKTLAINVPVHSSSLKKEKNFYFFFPWPIALFVPILYLCLMLVIKQKTHFILLCLFLIVFFPWLKDIASTQIKKKQERKNYRIGQLQPAHHSCTSYAWNLVCTARGVSRFHHRLHRIPSTRPTNIWLL